MMAFSISSSSVRSFLARNSGIEEGGGGGEGREGGGERGGRGDCEL